MQYRIAVAKKQEVVSGPDDAAVVITVPIADATKDPHIAFMQGKLKVAGPMAPFFAALQSGEVAAELAKTATSIVS
jgi:hypothetical protein